MAEISGPLCDVRFHRDNFLVGQIRRLDQEGREEFVTICGSMILPQLHAEYRLSGDWDEHHRFGRQFRFAEYQAVLPTSDDAVISYLRELPGIGPGVAAKLLERLGNETLYVLRTDPERVARSSVGLSVEKARKAAEILTERHELEAASLELRRMLAGTNVTRPALKRILDRWRHKAPEQIRRDPYQLTAIHGIGFHTADQVGRNLPAPDTVAIDSPARIIAGMIHTLEEAAGDGGHTCLPCRALLDVVARLLGLEAERDILPQLLPAYEAGKIEVIIEGDEPDPPGGGLVYLTRLARAEFDVARMLGGLVAAGDGIWHTPGGSCPALDGLEADQVQAVEAACQSRVFLLTGAPGTGKTYTIRRLLDSFRGLRVMLCAPTGKAAKRIAEQTGQTASTIHSLLGVEGCGGEGAGWRFRHNEEDPLNADALIVDEMSMVDVSLMRSLLAAVKLGTRLILVGDSYQLPSVGPGNVLRDIVDSDVISHVELTRIKRQDPGLIVTNCHRIKDGKQPLRDDGSGTQDMLFVDLEEAEEIQRSVRSLVAELLPAKFALSREEALREIQVITPLREKTELGAERLNLVLQEAINPATPENAAPEDFPAKAREKFRLDDKVIQLRNDYGLGIVNGDIGRIAGWAPKDDHGPARIRVRFECPARTIEIKAGQNDLDLAYALTCHKFQGSEARVVVIPMHRCFGSLIVQRNWVYTAISRARELCVIVGQENALWAGVRRVSQAQRCTRLAAHLRRACS